MAYDPQSGYFEAGSNTPTGAPMQVAVDNPYVTKDEFISGLTAAGLGITKTAPVVNDVSIYESGELDRVLLEASAAVNRYTGRWFDTQTIDETKTNFEVRPYNPQLVSVVLKNRPYTKINSIYIQVLQWFIQVITYPPSLSYLQDFYDKGFYRIVPLLSTAGTGVGSPIPAAILDKVPLGILWTNYTFGYGKALTGQTLTVIGKTKQYQSPLGNRLWAPSQTLTVYDNGTTVPSSDYTVDYPNGIITFNSSYTVTGAVTADFTTNETVPFEIKEATKLVAAFLIGQSYQNPLGATGMTIQTYSMSFGSGETLVEKRFQQLLQPYKNVLPIIMGY